MVDTCIEQELLDIQRESLSLLRTQTEILLENNKKKTDAVSKKYLLVYSPAMMLNYMISHVYDTREEAMAQMTETYDNKRNSNTVDSSEISLSYAFIKYRNYTIDRWSIIEV